MGIVNDDERFEEFLRDAAAEYQAPRGDVPRDEMWAAIAAQRAVRGTESTRPHIVPASAPQRHVRSWAWIGMAATLVFGVLIGRYAMDRQPGLPTVATTPAVAPSPATAPVAEPNRAIVAPVGDIAKTNTSATAPDVAPRTSPYSVASSQHLQSVQVLLATYAADSGDARSDSLVSAWARNLLSNTRLLLDSPAARDPQRARLLQDLEVILVQLVQRTPGGDADARSALDRSIQKSQIIPRLRSALPASLHSGTE